MTRKIRLALGLKLAALLLAIGLMPVRAWAESPIEFYENLAETVGVSVDLASEAWQDKTINAYLEYINQNISGGTPYSFYQYGVQLEALTGYDVAYVENGKYYINSAPGDGAGGAFYGVECNTWNLSSLALETSKWLKYAAENGPEWPNGTSGGGGNDDVISSTVVCNGIAGDYIVGGNWVPVSGTSKTVNFTNYQTIKKWLTDNGYTNTAVLLTYNSSSSLNASVNVYAAKGEISLSYTDNGTTQNGHQRKVVTVTGTGLVKNVESYTFNTNNNDINCAVQSLTQDLSGSQVINSHGFWYSGVSSGGGNEPSDEPPIETPQAPNIVFPGITLPDFPDFNTTNNYTPGEIDFTPIIERLDDIDADLELFYNSFNEFRADFLTYMNGIGDALNTINQSIWSCEQRLESVITWLKNIFSRLGGTGGSKPDPSTNQDGFWEWLREMLEKLFGALPTETDDMLTQFQRLTTRFPFSVPWDVYALLAMFVSQPVTPVIDMPFPMPEVIYPNGYFMAHIDLTPYDGVAAMVRKLELVAFVGWLTWRTFDMIRGGEEVVG